MSERITVSVNEFIEMSGLGRDSVYQLIRNRDIKSIKVGRRRVIEVKSYQELIDRGGPKVRRRKRLPIPRPILVIDDNRQPATTGDNCAQESS